MNDEFWQGFLEGCLSTLRKSLLYFVFFFIVGWLWVTLFGVGVSVVVVLLGLAILLGLLL